MITAITIIAIDHWELHRALDTNSTILKDYELARKKVLASNVSNKEYARFTIISERIEELFRELILTKDLTLKTTAVLDTEYMYCLQVLAEKAPEYADILKLATTYLAAEDIPEHIMYFQHITQQLGIAEYPAISERLRVLQHAERYDLSIIEVPNSFAEEAPVVQTKTVEAQTGLFGKFLRKQKVEEVIEEVTPDTKYQFDPTRYFYDEYMTDTGFTDNKELKTVEVFEKQLQLSLQSLYQGTPIPINVTTISNDVITEALQRHLHYKVGTSISLPVIYDDGSQGLPITLNSVQYRDKSSLAGLREYPAINVGLMSIRHPELDTKVHMYWFRNQEISITRTLAETDTICYRKSKELFSSIGSQPIRIRLYHTGFPPAIMGFYRALIEELISRNDKAPLLEVTPVYFRGGMYEEGTEWY